MQNDEGKTKTIIQNNSAQNNEANTNGKMTEARTTVPSANRNVNAKHTPETVGEECKGQTTDITKLSLVEETNKTATKTKPNLPVVSDIGNLTIEHLIGPSVSNRVKFAIDVGDFDANSIATQLF